MVVVNIETRFKTKYKKSPNGCWEWTAYISERGYAKFSFPHNGYKTRPGNAHRYSYEKYIGKLRKGMTIDHLCRNRKCVNPKHLEQVSWQENLLRGEGIPAINAKKTHCKRGHEFTKANTRIITKIHHKSGKKYKLRSCKICEMIRQRPK